MTRTIQKSLLALMLTALCAATALAADVTNEAFSISSPGDSWVLHDLTPTMRSIGSGVTITHYGSGDKAMELVGITSLDGAFDPAEYLDRQIVRRQDVFAKTASGLSAVADTTFAGFPAKIIHFAKQHGNTGFVCSAMAFNVGFTTFYIVQGHDADINPYTGTLLRSLKFNTDTARLYTAAHYAKAIAKVLKRHTLTIGRNEYLKAMEMPDSGTVAFTVTIPYLSRDNVEPDAFVASKRADFLKTLTTAYGFNLFTRAIIDQKLTFRYVYVDTKGKEIATMALTPADYSYLKFPQTKQ